MGRVSRFSQDVRKRAVRMVFEHGGEYGFRPLRTEWGVTPRLGPSVADLRGTHVNNAKGRVVKDPQHRRPVRASGNDSTQGIGAGTIDPPTVTSRARRRLALPNALSVEWCRVTERSQRTRVRCRKGAVQSSGLNRSGRTGKYGGRVSETRRPAVASC